MGIYGLAIATCMGVATPVSAFTYVAASEVFANRITHPHGYTGEGGTLYLSVAIAPETPRYENMVESILNVVDTWNALQPTLGNVRDHATEPITPIQFDFESVLLHEVGHALGLGHGNLASESGLTGEDMEYTKSAQGRNGKWDLDSGDDGIIGSADDNRRDDVNFNWFKTDSNNPFEIASVVDSTTYSLNIADLPGNDSFSANASRDVAGGLYDSYEDGDLSEAVMQQGTYGGEVQRQLSFDDVAGIRYAQSGMDEIAGTSDDYMILLEYVGIDALADMVITYDADTEFASTNFVTNGMNGSFTHVTMSPTTITFNDSINWYYTLPEGCIEGDINCDGAVSLLDLDILGRNYGQADLSRFEGDLSGDGEAGLIDLDILGLNFGNTSVPEPATGLSLAMAALIVSWRRRSSD